MVSVSMSLDLFTYFLKDFARKRDQTVFVFLCLTESLEARAGCGEWQDCILFYG